MTEHLRCGAVKYSLLVKDGEHFVFLRRHNGPRFRLFTNKSAHRFRLKLLAKHSELDIVVVPVGLQVSFDGDPENYR